jgi:hypothetical protein
MKSKWFPLVFVFFVMTSCVSTKSTLQNVDDTAPIPRVTATNTFVITEYSKDKKYGFDKDYPINVFYRTTTDENANQLRFLNALAGPKGEKITFKKTGTCCPFPTKKNEMGVGYLDEYEITWEGQKQPMTLYLNYFEKGVLQVPIGLSLKK